jgi:uncharacterized membrane protein YphA (DoxX/SURF4 family)
MGAEEDMNIDNPKPDDLSKKPGLEQAEGLLYKTPSEALQAVHQDYLYWTGKLTDTSLQLSIAVIGANWAVFGSAERVLNNLWAELSIMAVLIALALNLLGAHLLGHLHKKQRDYAEEDPTRWKHEFSKFTKTLNPWPFTRWIERWAFCMRCVKTLLPIIGGILFLIAFFTTPKAAVGATRRDKDRFNECDYHAPYDR